MEHKHTHISVSGMLHRRLTIFIPFKSFVIKLKVLNMDQNVKLWEIEILHLNMYKQENSFLLFLRGLLDLMKIN